MKHCFLTLGIFFGLLAGAEIQAAPHTWGPGLKILIIAGGWAHDYQTWFNKADSATLSKAGFTNTFYTEDPVVAAEEMPQADLIIMSANWPREIPPQFIQGLSNHVAAGKAFVFVHSGVWINWSWTKADNHEFNTALIGGGADSHDGEAPFDEVVIKEHPVTEGLPKTFPAVDELYHMRTLPNASPIEVLVETKRAGEQKYMSVWIVHYHDCRIACIALGHDGNSHNSPYYQKLLVNAVKWAGKQ